MLKIANQRQVSLALAVKLSLFLVSEVFLGQGMYEYVLLYTIFTSIHYSVCWLKKIKNKHLWPQFFFYLSILWLFTRVVYINMIKNDHQFAQLFPCQCWHILPMLRAWLHLECNVVKSSTTAGPCGIPIPIFI